MREPMAFCVNDINLGMAHQHTNSEFILGGENYCAPTKPKINNTIQVQKDIQGRVKQNIQKFHFVSTTSVLFDRVYSKANLGLRLGLTLD